MQQTDESKISWNRSLGFPEAEYYFKLNPNRPPKYLMRVRSTQRKTLIKDFPVDDVQGTPTSYYLRRAAEEFIAAIEKEMHANKIKYAARPLADDTAQPATSLDAISEREVGEPEREAERDAQPDHAAAPSVDDVAGKESNERPKGHSRKSGKRKS